MVFASFMTAIVAINIVLFIHRTYYFRNFTSLDGTTPNPFYLLSRGCGKTLLFNSVLILVLVLRYTLTTFRGLGLSSILPLDHNIYIHKVVGFIILFQAWLHTIMHLINLGQFFLDPHINVRTLILGVLQVSIYSPTQ